VCIAGSPGDRWAFWHGHVFHDAQRASNVDAGSAAARARRAHSAHALTAPMPATVIKVLVTPGSTVKKGDTVILLEAMKMELPLRAPADATVRAVHCREGELVQPDATLIELE
jgi:biotin carboxyl carrier protein